MKRYFKIKEINRKEFMFAVGEDIDGAYKTIITPQSEEIFVSLEDDNCGEILILLNDFDEWRG